MKDLETQAEGIFQSVKTYVDRRVAGSQDEMLKLLTGLEARVSQLSAADSEGDRVKRHAAHLQRMESKLQSLASRVDLIERSK